VVGLRYAWPAFHESERSDSPQPARAFTELDRGSRAAVCSRPPNLIFTCDTLAASQQLDHRPQHRRSNLYGQRPTFTCSLRTRTHPHLARQPRNASASHRIGIDRHSRCPDWQRHMGKPHRRPDRKFRSHRTHLQAGPTRSRIHRYCARTIHSSVRTREENDCQDSWQPRTRDPKHRFHCGSHISCHRCRNERPARHEKPWHREALRHLKCPADKRRASTAPDSPTIEAASYRAHPGTRELPASQYSAFPDAFAQHHAHLNHQWPPDRTTMQRRPRSDHACIREQRRKNNPIEALASYVEALGGELAVVAVLASACAPSTCRLTITCAFQVTSITTSTRTWIRPKPTARSRQGSSVVATPTTESTACRAHCVWLPAFKRFCAPH
jgi:hypothetical protein